MSTEQKIRAVLFHVSLVIFFVAMPFIISFALGYKFNVRTFKFTKTGLIVFKTQPSGANIYLNQKMLAEKTPSTISELMPGKYHLSLELENYYPYSCEVEVDPGKVTRLDRVILFPLRPNVKQLNVEKISSFLIDEDSSTIYYIDEESGIIFKSNFDGENFEEVGEVEPLKPQAKKWKISRDKEKILYFNNHQVAVSYLYESGEQGELNFVLNFPGANIEEAFWHTDNYHIILVNDKEIQVIEARSQPQEPLAILKLNRRTNFSFYDARTNKFYFLDVQMAGDGRIYDNVYQLDLNTKLNVLKDLIRLKNE